MKKNNLENCLAGWKRIPVMLLLTVAFFLFFAYGCGEPGDFTATGPEKEKPGTEERAEPRNAHEKKELKVAVSVVPQKTFVEKIAGDLAEVVLLVPPGYSPGNYEPTPQEMEDFSRASLYFSIGVPTEEANILPQARELDGLEIIDLHGKVGEHYPERQLEEEDSCGDHESRDPHIWLSPARVKVMVEIMAEELARVDEANSELYMQNARAYLEELEELDQELEEIFSNLENRKFIVFHPAFGYLADDYDLQMYALEHGGKEATPQRMQEIIDLARKEDIRVIFYQEEIDSKQSETFAEEIGGQTVKLSPLASNYVENLRLMAETMAEELQ